jgi:hypothetical protein
MPNTTVPPQLDLGPAELFRRTVISMTADECAACLQRAWTLRKSEVRWSRVVSQFD